MGKQRTRIVVSQVESSEGIRYHVSVSGITEQGHLHECGTLGEAMEFSRGFISTQRPISFTIEIRGQGQNDFTVKPPHDPNDRAYYDGVNLAISFSEAYAM